MRLLLQLLLALLLATGSMPFLLRRLTYKRLHTGQLQKALNLARWFYAVSPFSARLRAEAASLIARIYQYLRMFDRAAPYVDEAYAYYERANPKPSFLSEVPSIKILQLFRENQYEEAVALAEREFELHPHLSESLTMLTGASQVYIAVGNFAKAEELLDKVIALGRNPLASLCIGGLVPAYRYALMTKSLCRYFQHDLIQSTMLAHEAWESLREESPRPEPAILRAKAQILRCLACRRLFDATYAFEQEMHKKLSLLNGYSRAFVLRALALKALLRGEFDRARSLAEHSIILNLDPDDYADALLIQAGVFAARANYARTVSLCHQILDQRANNPFYKEQAEKLLRLVAEAEMEGRSDPILPDTWCFPEWLPRKRTVGTADVCSRKEE
ncbi:tetratricopeptide repeat protein [Chthonomonas calidirosea]|uniref:tetratricopeptide repeat protein n=1 Tax=Chthonomonas calidirosea TaxID=454171 RepID=UPI0006EC555E|nr:tetratricopeptide repeat protein [Chthonomonas calidirosea]CEK17985.1 hypothetical protein CP488_02030 [Chthonomonas calidirosea]